MELNEEKNTAKAAENTAEDEKYTDSEEDKHLESVESDDSAETVDTGEELPTEPVESNETTGTADIEGDSEKSTIETDSEETAGDTEESTAESMEADDGTDSANQTDSSETGTGEEKAEETDEKSDSAAANDTDRSENENSEEKEEEYRRLGLYIHVPFCRSKCAYCDFYSTDKYKCAGRKAPEEMRAYVTAAVNQMRFYSERTTQFNVDTIFIGGGTPTALPPKLLLELIKAVDDCFYLENGYEFTVEVNPATADKPTLRAMRHHGVNRLSIGLQTANDAELAALSRIHDVGDFAECFQNAREAGFTNINVDVMYGIPEQTAQSFQETLEFVCNMKPEHISMYNLRIEEGTPFGERKNMLPLPDEDTECAMYFDGISYLRSRGYHQYEISNFAKDGKECRHNLRYWLGQEYIGVGPAAHSYFGGRRFSFRKDLALFSQTLSEPQHKLSSSLLDENYEIDTKEELAEYLMLRLRLSRGIDTADFYTRFGADFEEHFGKKLAPYIKAGFMKRTVNPTGASYAFTPKGMFVSNYILARIIPFEPKMPKENSPC